jgi:hypothetical protein
VTIKASRLGEVGVRALRPAPRTHPEVDVGSIVLEPGSRLVVRVRDANGGAASARVFACVQPRGVPPSFFGPRDVPWSGWPFEATTDARGVAVFDPIARGDLRLLATAPGPLRGEARGRVGGDRAEASVVLERGRDVEVTVLSEGDETPLAGLAVAVYTAVGGDDPQRAYPADPLDDPVPSKVTDAHGRTVLPNLPLHRLLFLHALAARWAWPEAGDSKCPLPAGVQELTIRVPRPTRTEWPIDLGERDPPPDGWVVALAPAPEDLGFGWRSGVLDFPASDGRIDGGNLVIEGRFRSRTRGTARLPDGRMGRITPPSPGNFARPVRFVRPRALDVVVREEGGRRAAGVGVAVRDSMGRTTRRTGDDGVARFSDLLSDSVDVSLTANADLIDRENRWGVFHAVAAHVDLRGGTGRIELSVPDARTASLFVTVDGRPGFPPGFSLRVMELPEALDGVEPADARYDAMRGEVRFTVRPPVQAPASRVAWGLQTPYDLGTRIHAVVRAPGFSPAGASFARRESDGALAARVDVRSAPGSVRLAVRRPVDGRVHARIQKWVESAWESVHSDPSLLDPALHEGLVPGTYRVIDALSGIVGTRREVSGGGPVTLDLDVSKTAEIIVGIDAPPDIDMIPGRLVLFGEGLTSEEQEDGRADDPEGTRAVRLYAAEGFRVRVPGDRPVTLRVEHPFLRPAVESGPRMLVAPKDGLRFRMVRADHATVRIPGIDRETFWRWSCHVLVAHDDGGLRAVESRPTADGVQFGGYGTGRRDVWIDLAPYAPTRLPSANLVGSPADLGVASMEAGATLSLVTSHAADGVGVWVIARSSTPYAHVRGGLQEDANHARVRGLGAGRYEIEIRRADEAQSRLLTTVSSDGRTPISLEVDLRLRAD